MTLLLPSSPCVLEASSHQMRDLLAADNHKTNLSRMATEPQASAHAEATDRAVALHIDLWRFDVVFLHASFKRRQIETAVVGAERSLLREGQPVYGEELDAAVDVGVLQSLNQRIKQRQKP